MARYYYTCRKDKKLIKKSFLNVAYVIFGKRNSDKINDFNKYFEQMVSNVSIFPQGSLHNNIDSKHSGICRLDDQSGKLIIEMFGYKRANSRQSAFIKHVGTHEFCHSFVDLLPKLESEHQDGIINGDIRYENHMGMIRKTNTSTGELINPGHYGKMFNETMMDIISSIAINYFDSNRNSKTATDILSSNYNNWENEKTGYSIFTSLTRLVIAAFSNSADIDYDNIIKNGYGIFDVKTRLKNGISLYANDFLYGIVYDPLHIEEEFDKFVGIGCYRDFCESLDNFFLLSLDEQKLQSNIVKTLMLILSNFLNDKIDYYTKNNLMDLSTANRIAINFNRIWDSMQEEYCVRFSREDIIGIYRRRLNNKA